MRDPAPIRAALNDLKAVCARSSTKLEAYRTTERELGSDMAETLRYMPFFNELPPVIRKQRWWEMWSPDA